MANDKMREEFEAWYLDKYCGGQERLRRCSNDESTYYYCGVQAMWTPWQASRESMVIELPERSWPVGHNYPLANYDTTVAAEQANDEAIEECRAAIIAAGPKVKP